MRLHTINVMPAMKLAADLLIGCPDDEVAENASNDLNKAILAVADLILDVKPVLESLRERITQDNAMEPQAVMVRRAWDSLQRCNGDLS